ncbi:MAG: OsmC family protein [Desulfobacterales bacterium]|nr:OsmC family protein [Desulfobacterales bacterium]
MNKVIDVTFPGGKKVYAQINDRIIHTDQTIENGGEGTAPEPFHLFVASIATCAGVYALEFCQARKIPAEGMGLTMTYEWDERKQACEKFNINLRLPPGFPDKYKKAVIRVMDLCAVKRHIVNPPEFIITADY